MLKPINIAICDDQEIQVELFFKYVNNWADKNKQKVKIESFNCAESFHFKWLEDKSFDIILLDIEMPGQNGIELAKTIRKSDKLINIIFITAVTDFIAEGYDVDAINYLLKPIDEGKLHSCLDRAVDRIPLKESKIVIQTENGAQIILEKDILFIESISHKIEITINNKKNNTKVYDERFSNEIAKVKGNDETIKDRGNTKIVNTKKYSTRMNLATIEAELDQDTFIKPHRSYLVNLLHIKRIRKDSIELDNGDKVPLSRRRYKEVNMKFIKFFSVDRGDKDE